MMRWGKQIGVAENPRACPCLFSVGVTVPPDLAVAGTSAASLSSLPLYLALDDCHAVLPQNFLGRGRQSVDG